MKRRRCYSLTESLKLELRLLTQMLNVDQLQAKIDDAYKTPTVDVPAVQSVDEPVNVAADEMTPCVAEPSIPALVIVCVLSLDFVVVLLCPVPGRPLGNLFQKRDTN